MNNRLLLGILLLFLSNTTFAQIDKEFWFAAPYANPSNGRTPVYIRFQSFDKPSTIKIEVPANPAINAITIQLKANSSYSLDITRWLYLIENDQADIISPKGLHIISTTEIYVYYEIFGSNSYGKGTNSDLFTLKGRNALGTEFYTPFQTRFDNYLNINAYASFDIVATENNTHVTITPTQAIVSYAPNIPFTIILNKGETWSGRAFFTEAINRPTGSHIQSTKPIAVTVKDDSMFKGNNWDIGGDQLIPLSQLGTDYIVIKHIANIGTDNDYAYVLATKDNTSIYTKGDATPIAVLNKGMQLEIPISQSVLIHASEPIYVLHLTGLGNELAEAILPQINCTGSKAVGFIRSNDETLVLNILTKTGSQNSFSLNGNTTLIKATDFAPVIGASNWLYASIEFTTSQIPALKANLLTNSIGYFHLGLMNGSSDETGFRYGYFSDFGFTSLGSDTTICANTTIELSAGIQKDSYQWLPNGETTSRIFTQDSGTYYVRVIKEGCTFEDSIHISFFPQSGPIIKNKDDSICANETIVIRTNSGFNKFVWSTFAQTDSIVVSKSNTYKVSAKDTHGCVSKDSVIITSLPLPNGIIQYTPTDNQVACASPLVDLTAPPNYSAYSWYDGSSSPYLHTQKTDNGIYWVTLTDSFGCRNKIFTEIDCSIYIEVYNLITPNGDGKNDYFEIKDLQDNTYELKIYNSWGALVYAKNPYNNNIDSGELADGLYYYSLTHYKNKRNLKGWLHVIR
ncbi:gliding motility-associated C-terminal domain-containing protein [uncultured Cytophaga sp.]|uniref:gliding motility-associated C-terminal domain-containing protein n=1 Tax=uncultured Cytophaga sp. TaxID=160238 RepID=UPI0026270C46|nr:gliding motility-associated C-terminal domain-containing protein [uncultured Cytophaga sp.]